MSHGSALLWAASTAAERVRERVRGDGYAPCATLRVYFQRYGHSRVGIASGMKTLARNKLCDERALCTSVRLPRNVSRSVVHAGSLRGCMGQFQSSPDAGSPQESTAPVASTSA